MVYEKGKTNDFVKHAALYSVQFSNKLLRKWEEFLN